MVYNKNGDVMNKNDLRYIKTEEIIRKSFMDIVLEKGFDKTRVSDICEKARISRNTFYTHHEDKYALLDVLFEEFRTYFEKSFSEQLGNELMNYDFTNSILWYMENVKEHHEDYLLLLQCSTDRFMEIAMDVIIRKPMRNYYDRYDSHVKKDIRFKLNVNYMFQGMIHFTKIWLENYDRISFEEAVSEISMLCDGPLRMYINKLKKLG